MLGEHRQFGAYQIVRTLGIGGMGVVYEGRHHTLNRRVAVKVLHPDRLGDRMIVERFLNEARATNEIRHDGVVKIFDADRLDDGTPFLIMEYLAGNTLAEYLVHKGTVELSVLMDLGEQLAETLDAAHRHAVIHRDLKPENIILVPENKRRSGLRTKILDFGIAKLTGSLGNGKTQAGFMGTPRYASPEQVQNAADVTHKADVYSLGCILYKCACGQTPFDAPLDHAILMKQVLEKPVRLDARVSHIGVELSDLIDQMLDKDPKARPSMSQVAENLREIREHLMNETRIVMEHPAPNLGLPSPGGPGSRAPLLPAEFSVGFNTPRNTPSSKELAAATYGKHPRARWVGLWVATLAFVSVVSLLVGRQSKSNERTAGTQPAEVAAPVLDLCQVVAEPSTATISNQEDRLLAIGSVVFQRPRGSPSIRLKVRAEGFSETVIEVSDGCQEKLAVSLKPSEGFPPPAQINHQNNQKRNPRAGKVKLF